MDGDRRATKRCALHGILLNKYVGGFPHAVRLVDISETGIRIRALLEPEPDEPSQGGRFALELEVPSTGERLWLWAREVWRQGKKQALTFSGMSAGDRDMLRALLGEGELA